MSQFAFIIPLSKITISVNNSLFGLYHECPCFTLQLWWTIIHILSVSICFTPILNTHFVTTVFYIYHIIHHYTNIYHKLFKVPSDFYFTLHSIIIFYNTLVSTSIYHKALQSLNTHWCLVISIYDSSISPIAAFLTAVFQSLIFQKFYFLYAFLQYSSAFGRGLNQCFLYKIGVSIHLSHCLSMGKLVWGYIGLDLLLHFETAKVHKNC